ncbi:hypothetical protein K144312032_p10250 (plasmid) [Clostridium tetani]|uniref:hypothetical protein n=1 Tax=Clostridium tetani TaxID=1513 RepID=UPI002955AEA3|nr:hypothetical protein [Clostridium tetani]BDR68535.1 hypothetical protein K144312032_p10250 [Clostridium tetani]
MNIFNSIKADLLELIDLKPDLIQLYSLHYARLRNLVKLMELREGMCRMEDDSLKATGQREFMCFLYRYWSSCYEWDIENALKSTLDFNKQFREPLNI